MVVELMTRLLVLLSLLLFLLSLALSCHGGSFFEQIYLAPVTSPSQHVSLRRISLGIARKVQINLPLAPFQRWPHSLNHAPAPAPSPISQVHNPRSNTSIRQYGHHHKAKPQASPLSQSIEQGCYQTCSEPLTSTPIGSPCGCVFPMKVKFLFDVDLVSLFPVLNELEIEVAVGTYLKQSQVKIVGAVSNDQNQGETIVDVNLVPLGDKFDNTTATITYERLWKRKVLLNASLFGSYDVINITYPGIPSSALLPVGNGPTANPGNLPITADFVKNHQQMSHVTIAIVAFSALVLLLVCIGAIFSLLKWKKAGMSPSAVGPVYRSSINKRSGIGSVLSSSITSSTSLSLMSAMNFSALSVKRFSLQELDKATEKFSVKRVLGEGGFGRVYRGTMEDGTEVAVKLLTRDNQNGDREFVAEVEMLSRLHHRNLVKLIGICIEQRTRCLVYELVSNGSVESHLHGPDRVNGPLEWEVRLKIALGAARGLAYLHEDSNPRVIHRDFKASNVLLEDDFTPKVSDFGLAREATEGSHHISTRVMGTFGYVAPEYAMTGHLLVKSDVYSYGVVLLELLSGRKPVDMSQSQGQENLVTWARPLLTSREGLQQLVDPSLEGKFVFDDMAKVAAIASMCVHPEVTHRPFMGEVVQALKLIYDDKDETCGDCYSRKDSSANESDYKGELAPSDSSWWNVTPRLTYGHASSFITMEYSSGPLDDMERNQRFSTSSLIEDGVSLPIKHGNRSGPLRTVRSKPAFYRLKGGSMSEHSAFIPRHGWNDGYLV